MRHALFLGLCLLQLAALAAARAEPRAGPQALLGRRTLASSGRALRALNGDEACRSALSQAFALCRSAETAAPDKPCCSALQAAGSDCLRQAEAAAAGSAEAAEALSALLNSCGTSSGSSSKADTQPSQLPAGQVQLSWSVDADAAPCFNYVPGPDGNWTLDTTSGPWGAAGNVMPPAENVERASELLCSNPQDGGQELLQALTSGGEAAQAAVAAALNGCANSSEALNAAFYELGQADELQDPASVLKYVETFRDAAEAVGAGACITVVVLDPSGSLLASRKVHTTVRRLPPSSDGGGSNSTGDSSGGGSNSTGDSSGGGSNSTGDSSGGGSNSTGDSSGGSGGTVTSSSVDVAAACQQAFVPALRACNGSTADLGPGSGCCTAVEGVGEGCLLQLAASLAANQTRLAELEHILDECGIDSNVTAGTGAATPSPSPDQLPSPSIGSSSSGNSSISSSGSGGTEDVTLPPISSSSEGTSSGGNGTLADGRIALFLSIAPGPVPCYNYTPGQESNWTANPTGGLWEGTGSAIPPDDTVDELSNELCSSPESGAAALLAAFEAGGAQAQSAVASMLGGGSCLNPAAINAALSAFGNLPELNDPGLVLSYVDALVAAADEIGVGVCVSVASLDRESAAVLDFREVHVSGSSNSSSSDGGSGSSSGTAGSGTAPGADDGTVHIAAGGNGTLPQLPAGKVLTAWSVGPSGQCAAYNESSGEWHNAALFPFGGEGDDVPPRDEYQSLGEQLCQEPQQAAAMLVDAMAAGGEEARSAVAALLSYNCPEGPLQMQAAFDAFTNATELRQPDTALRYIAAFVQAADEVGGGACVSLVVTNDSGSVVAAYRVHSNGPAGGALLKEPEQEEDGGSGSSNSSESSSGGGSGAGSQDVANESLDWIRSFYAASQPAAQ